MPLLLFHFFFFLLSRSLGLSLLLIYSRKLDDKSFERVPHKFEQDALLIVWKWSLGRNSWRSDWHSFLSKFLAPRFCHGGGHGPVTQGRSCGISLGLSTGLLQEKWRLPHLVIFMPSPKARVSLQTINKKGSTLSILFSGFPDPYLPISSQGNSLIWICPLFLQLCHENLFL